MQTHRCMAVKVPAHLECAICFDTLRAPVQLLRCGHIFCTHCVRDAHATRCAVCGSDVVGTQSPSEELCGAAAAVAVVCSRCGWRGTRHDAETHCCGSDDDDDDAHERRPSRTHHNDEESVTAAATATATTADVHVVSTTVRYWVRSLPRPAQRHKDDKGVAASLS